MPSAILTMQRGRGVDTVLRPNTMLPPTEPDEVEHHGGPSTPRRHLPAAGLAWTYYTLRRCARRFAQPPMELLFYPERPSSMHYVIWKICAELGLRATGIPSRRTALALLWKDATSIAPLEAAPPITAARLLNAGCRDISKVNVARHFRAVFGYGCDVDPLAYPGPCVEKSNQNARHDGRIVFGPSVTPRAGAVYQRVINNIVAGGMVEDIRVPVIGGAVPFAYLKYRPRAVRFDSSKNAAVRLCAAQDVLSADEMVAIGAFAQRMGLDYGELDVLRDRDDGRIYILDANKTPAGPSYRLPGADARRAIERLALAFREEFLSGGWRS